MPSTRDIRRRIRSVKNTAQITKAMQMVAASKMRKAQQAALAGRPYATLMNEVLGEVTASAACWARRILAAATICMALVICAVFFTDRMRRRMSRVLGMDYL